ncbi:hypothetical protein [Rhizobium sp. BK176]|uniref:hypothetical protein n=1 Tax=Rhizobium sp. BK176 TaxID=2587071 RepID=UPI00216A6A76|nr:hypothetical protein [Rhizobium sp. BK176]MCS4088885.1 hypothetical protein [Rhizobium sp. BK176]
MHLNLRYHFMARAALRPGGETGWQKFAATKGVEIAERSDAEAPMAFVFKEQMQKTPHYLRYDHRAGALFLRHSKANRVEARNDSFQYDLDYPTRGMRKWNEERYAPRSGPKGISSIFTRT